MKKFIAILAVAGVMTACGNAKTEEVKKDSVAAPAVDSTKKDTSKVAIDTTKKDSTKK
jgi:hypothetical protein